MLAIVYHTEMKYYDWFDESDDYYINVFEKLINRYGSNCIEKYLPSPDTFEEKINLLKKDDYIEKSFEAWG